MIRRLVPAWILPTLALAALLAALLAGCAANPVTGQSELALVSTAQELRLGEENYDPMRQSQGGDYNVDPAVTDYVQRIGQRLAAASDRELPYEFEVINNSVPNAWALPGGKIAVNRGLLVELDNEAELAAVLGHEIVHAAARHSAQAMQRAMILQGAVIGTAVAASGEEYGGLITAGAQIGAMLLSQTYSRGAESEADYYGMQYMSRAGYDPQAAVSLQETFVRLSGERSSGWLNGLFASHPPSPQRVDANRRTAASLAGGGELGRDAYQRGIQPLIASREAYAAYEEGRKALEDGEADKALRLADKAISIEPREALFHGLRGDVHYSRKRFADAEAAFDRAIRLNREYFYFPLRRGETRLQRGDKAGAREDLSASMKLLPTEHAQQLLSRLGG